MYRNNNHFLFFIGRNHRETWRRQKHLINRRSEKSKLLLLACVFEASSSCYIYLVFTFQRNLIYLFSNNFSTPIYSQVEKKLHLIVLLIIDRKKTKHLDEEAPPIKSRDSCLLNLHLPCAHDTLNRFSSLFFCEHNFCKFIKWNENKKNFVQLQLAWLKTIFFPLKRKPLIKYFSL